MSRCFKNKKFELHGWFLKLIGTKVSSQKPDKVSLDIQVNKQCCVKNDNITYQLRILLVKVKIHQNFNGIIQIIMHTWSVNDSLGSNEWFTAFWKSCNCKWKNHNSLKFLIIWFVTEIFTHDKEIKTKYLLWIFISIQIHT